VRAPERRGSRSIGEVLALVGPTASGKTEAGIDLARRLGAEILVIDSMTVYRGMDIGTAKPDAESRSVVPHHLLDVADPGELFSVARFQALARGTLMDLRVRGVPGLLVGGSGLYFRAVVDDLRIPGTDRRARRLLEAEGVALGPERLHRRLASLDPDAAPKIDPANVRRTVRALEVAAITGRPFSSFAGAWDLYPPGRVRAVGVDIPSEALRQRIEARVHGMVAAGLVDEVAGLIDRGSGPFLTSSQAIGYLEAALHLEGRLSEGEMVERTIRRTRALARRQMAWFRRDPRIRWVEAAEDGATKVVDMLEEHLR
jgi:tRNA dimethylallyltransferase